MEVLLRLLALLGLLLVGTGLRTVGILGANRTKRLNAAAYYVALPALVFVATYDRAISSIVSLELFVGVIVVLLGTAAVAWSVHRNRTSSARRSVAVVQSYHSNIGYLGVPLIAATFDDRVTAIASAILGFGSLVQVPLTVSILVLINGTSTRVRDQVWNLATNPVLLALLIGIVIGSFGIPVHGTIVVGLDALAALALPLALLCVGASLDLDLPDVDPFATGSVTVVKVAAMPVLAWLVFTLLAVDSDTFTAAVIMLAMPTAVSTYVFAGELGGDERFASLNVFVTTVASVASLFVLIALLG
ncbi:AEC family transporter [Halobacteria archaeon AArc-curdl1]|uniref:AEC family transporter n=1 Tax=Natronosalvus hydrolyticus TaxID=2979988 RepID=A0AAP2ZBB5_9EURY|nr:AEC family transporter [Halobacteria archaeon AArc-curdl1]